MKTIAIVVTYNRCDMLIECLDCLKQSEYPTDILIVDNASIDETKEYVQKFVDNKKIFYENTGRNIGGAGGFNYGLKKAYDMGYDYFWLMDDDTMVYPDSLGKIFDAIKIVGDNFGFISSLGYWTDGSLCKMNHHYISVNWNASKDLLKRSIVPIDIATFVSFFTRRDVVKSIGFPIKEYFIWGDDTEYSLRISRKYPSYLYANSGVLHKMKQNQGAANFSDFTDKERIKRMFFSFRNGCFTYKQQGRKKLLRHVMTGIKEMLKVVKSDKPYKMMKVGVIVKSYVKGIFFFYPKIEVPNN